MKMIKFIKGIRNFVQFFMGILMIQQRTCGKYSMKRCVTFLSFYSVSVVFLLFHTRHKFWTSGPPNCATANTRERFVHFQPETVAASQKQRWTLVTPDVYVYSAHLETCPSELTLASEHCVKFIAIVHSNRTSYSKNLKCVLETPQAIPTEVEIEVLPESHDKLFSAAFLFCPVAYPPTRAAIYEKSNSSLSWLSVERFEYKESARGISLCVKPLYDELVIVDLIQFLAYYSVMGVDHFVFYYDKSFRSLPDLSQTLKLSKVSGDVYWWDLPLGNDLIHEYGQIAFTQDCLARSKNRFKHTIIADLDEFIVPQSRQDIRGLVSYLDSEYPRAGSYVIPNVLFCKEYPVQNSSVLHPFFILDYNKRQRTHWAHRYRSKYIVRPERVRYGGVHFTWQLEQDFREVFVPPEIALMHHYRRCCNMLQTWFFHLFQFPVLLDQVIVDNALLNRRDQLMKNSLFKFVIDSSSNHILLS